MLEATEWKLELKAHGNSTLWVRDVVELLDSKIAFAADCRCGMKDACLALLGESFQATRILAGRYPEEK